GGLAPRQLVAPPGQAAVEPARGGPRRPARPAPPARQDLLVAAVLLRATREGVAAEQPDPLPQRFDLQDEQAVGGVALLVDPPPQPFPAQAAELVQGGLHGLGPHAFEFLVVLGQDLLRRQEEARLVLARPG